MTFFAICGFIWWAQFDRDRQFDRAEAACNELMRERVDGAPEMYLQERISDESLRFHVSQADLAPGWTCFAEKVGGDWQYDLYKD